MPYRDNGIIWHALGLCRLYGFVFDGQGNDTCSGYDSTTLYQLIGMQGGHHDVGNGVDAISTGISFTVFPLALNQQFSLKGKLS
jgi:hypothetical protein